MGLRRLITEFYGHLAPSSNSGYHIYQSTRQDESNEPKLDGVASFNHGVPMATFQLHHQTLNNFAKEIVVIEVAVSEKNSSEHLRRSVVLTALGQLTYRLAVFSGARKQWFRLTYFKKLIDRSPAIGYRTRLQDAAVSPFHLFDCRPTASLIKTDALVLLAVAVRESKGTQFYMQMNFVSASRPAAAAGTL
ncbi:hypothetical protein EVAR_28094_1 [Eumeta japonica]|uniref:Uncharacterized protein n=1 Tax=Eumeta variegata TaxID=151549 RepID=A0A4C1W9I2_EUMVA|nr:hypothetical protein EVAR_28094_1 [Eumeta japonica]